MLTYTVNQKWVLGKMKLPGILCRIKSGTYCVRLIFRTKALETVKPSHHIQRAGGTAS